MANYRLGGLVPPPEPKESTMAKKKKQTDEKVPKILIGVPILAWTHEFAESFLKFWTSLMTYSHKGRRFHVAYKFMYRMPVHMAEERLVDLAIASECTHVLMMDDDIYDVTVDMFLKLLDDDKDIVGGVMHASGFPHAMCAFRRYDTKQKVSDMPILKGPARLYEIPPDQRKGVQKVDLMAYPFTLFKVDIFKKLKKPWFKCDTQAPTDSWFSDSVLEAGLEYYCDFDVLLNHRGVTPQNVMLWRQMGQIKLQNDAGRVVVLSPDEMRRHEAFMSAKLADAEKNIKAEQKEGIVFYDKKKGKNPIAKKISPSGKRKK